MSNSKRTRNVRVDLHISDDEYKLIQDTFSFIPPVMNGRSVAVRLQFTFVLAWHIIPSLF